LLQNGESCALASVGNRTTVLRPSIQTYFLVYWLSWLDEMRLSPIALTVSGRGYLKYLHNFSPLSEFQQSGHSIYQVVRYVYTRVLFGCGLLVIFVKVKYLAYYLKDCSLDRSS
jgi:hypothetical protein